jgi:uncharacterized membrane protein YdbT with pleckstrin-like domain
MITLDGSTRQRARELAVKFTASPMLPILGWSKVVESIIAGGSLGNWVIYAVVVTVIWIFADDIERAAEEVVD